MLSVGAHEPGERNDVGQGLVDSLRGMTDYISRLQAENRKDPTQDRFYNMPTYKGCNISDEPESEDLSFNFIFNKFGKLFTFNVTLPLFANLPPLPLRKDAVDYYTEEVKTQDSEKVHNSDVVILKVLYHPFIKFLVGVASLANLLSLIAPIAISPIIPTAILSASLAIKALGVLASVAYAAPIFAYYFGKDFYMAKLENHFETIDEDLKNGRGQVARDKLKNLSFIFRFLLQPDFPNNRHLKRKYYMLSAQATLIAPYVFDNYISVLKYTDNAHDKILPLKAIINEYDDDLQDTILDHLKDCFSDARQRCEDAAVETARWQAPYIAQIPTDAPLYHELGAKVRAQIQDCIMTLRTEQFSKAAEQFYKIEWDAYSRYAYPDAAIMYYQMEAIVTFFSKKKTKPEPSNLEYDECINFGSDNESIIQTILDKYYPEKSQQYKEVMNAYEVTRKAIFTSREPRREYSVTELPEIYTPMALAAKQKHKPLLEEQEENLNAEQRRSSSPKQKL